MIRSVRFNSLSARHNQSGAALVIALMILVIISIVGLTALRSSVFNTKISTMSQASTMSFQGAETAIAAVFDEAVNQSFKTPGHVVSYAVAELGFGNNVVIDRCVTHGNLYLQRACTNNDFVDSRGLVQAGSRTMVKPTPRLKLNEVITDNTGGSTTIRYYDFVTVADAYVPVMKMSSFNVQEFTTEALSTGGPEH
jgi:Tfp pilus assembly protein PilX